MSVPTTDLTGSFWIAVGTMVFAFLGLATRYCYKSKCKEVSICCIHIHRDVEDEIIIDQQQQQPSQRKTSLDLPQPQGPRIITTL